jgi:DUF438 domain-containing protein
MAYVVYVVGFAGTGKLTIANELAVKIDAKVVDNQWVNNPIFGLIHTDGVTPLPVAVWVQVAKVREAVHETIATLAPASWSFIFTHDGSEGDAEDHAICESIKTTAARRNAVFVPIRLLCGEDELMRRVVSPGRKAKLKSIDPDAAKLKSRTEKVLDPRHPNGLTLDVTTILPEEAATLIHEHILSLHESK